MKCTAYVCTVIDHINSVYMNVYVIFVLQKCVRICCFIHVCRSSVLI